VERLDGKETQKSKTHETPGISDWQDDERCSRVRDWHRGSWCNVEIVEVKGSMSRDFEAEITVLEKRQEQVIKKMKFNESRLEDCAALQKEQKRLFNEFHDLRQQIDARREIASGYYAQVRRSLQKHELRRHEIKRHEKIR